MAAMVRYFFVPLSGFRSREDMSLMMSGAYSAKPPLSEAHLKSALYVATFGTPPFSMKVRTRSCAALICPRQP